MYCYQIAHHLDTYCHFPLRLTPCSHHPPRLHIRYESGGLLWPFLFSRILFILNVMAVFTACVMVVKQVRPRLH